jgi:hypothetical protein
MPGHVPAGVSLEELSIPLRFLLGALFTLGHDHLTQSLHRGRRLRFGRDHVVGRDVDDEAGWLPVLVELLTDQVRIDDRGTLRVLVNEGLVPQLG